MYNIDVGDQIKVTSCIRTNWYKLNEEHIVTEIVRCDDGSVKAYRTPTSGPSGYILATDVQKVVDTKVSLAPELPPSKVWTDSHYDTYYYLSEEDIEAGRIKLDTYLVAKVWKVGSKDDSGALWHSLKTINRFGQKNDVSREIQALYAQAKALARIYGVTLND